MKILLAFALVAIVAVSVAVCADFTKGVTAYEKGDYAAALKEWEPLAKGGGAAAQCNLGLLYYEGKGVPQDFREAARWFERSADQGYTKAQHNLGAMYGVGKGVKRDYGRAYMWLSLCAASGDSSCAGQRDLVADKLKGSKLAAAQRLTREWKPKTNSEPAK